MEEAGRIAAAIRKQRVLNAAAQLLLYMVWEPSLWCLSLRGDFFPQITLSGNTLPPHIKMCFHGDPKSLQVYREINCYVLGGLSPQPSEHLEFSSL